MDLLFSDGLSAVFVFFYCLLDFGGRLNRINQTHRIGFDLHPHGVYQLRQAFDTCTARTQGDDQREREADQQVYRAYHQHKSQIYQEI